MIDRNNRPDDEKIIINHLFETKALEVSPPSDPFFYTSGKIGPYYINTHYLFGSKSQAQDLLKYMDEFSGSKEDLISDLDCKLFSQYIENPIYRDVIDILADNASSLSFDFISGGERRDFFFSIPVARLLNKPHLSIFKDLSVVYHEHTSEKGVSDKLGANKSDAKSLDRWDADKSDAKSSNINKSGLIKNELNNFSHISSPSDNFSIKRSGVNSVNKSIIQQNSKINFIKNIQLKEQKALHIADLVTEASSYVRAWIPSVESLGGKIVSSLAVVDRDQGGREILEKKSISFIPLVTISKDMFLSAFDSNLITHNQYTMLSDFIDDPDEFVVSFFENNPEFLDNKIKSGGRDKERALLCIERGFNDRKRIK